MNIGGEEAERQERKAVRERERERKRDREREKREGGQRVIERERRGTYEGTEGNVKKF